MELIFLRFRYKSYFAPPPSKKNSCTHLQADNRVLVMPRSPLDILKKVLGMHAQVVTKPYLATSGQLTIKGVVNC